MRDRTRIRRTSLKSCLGIATALLVAASAFGEGSAASRPNVVVIIGDDISIGDFGCYGHPHIRTPNVDRLAAEGMRFTNTYLTTSQCSPTRCSIFTGRYPHNTGAPELHMPLPEGQPIFPLMLRQAGYYTAAAGKWHLGEYPKKAFDKIVGGGPGGEERWLGCLKGRPKDKPFFMWFAAHDAHRSWQLDDQAKLHEEPDALVPPYMVDAPGTRSDLASYYDEIHRLDRYTGLVMDELEKQGVADDTFVLFMADNGRPFPRCKTWLYDGGIKTPFIIRWPKGGVRPGGVCDALVSVIDIAPTILELANLELPKAVQGVSFSPLLGDPSASIRRYAFAEHNWHGQAACERMVRCENYVYIKNYCPELTNFGVFHLETPSYRDQIRLRDEGRLTPAQAEIFRVPRPVEMLFDVQNDPYQLTDLAGNQQHKAALKDLRGIMKQWRQDTGDTVPEVLTQNWQDPVTGKQNFPGYVPATRGDIPGSRRHAETINDPGPR